MAQSKTVYLVGNTGFVGSNLYAKYNFDKVANSSSVQEMYDDSPDVLVYAGVTGTKWYANLHEELDAKIIADAINNIKRINPRKLILISTVDVYDDLAGLNENHVSSAEKLNVYGRHRLELEGWVMDNIADYHIVRLPAIYGENIRKNFIFDLIYYIPHALALGAYEDTKSEYRSLFGEDMEEYYYLGADGMYYFNLETTMQTKRILVKRFRVMKHNALMFTNPNSEYQFYNLANLWKHIELIVEKGIEIVNLVTEPISAREVCLYIDNCTYESLSTSEIHYELTTKYSKYFIDADSDNYLYSREHVLSDLKKYIFDRRKMIAGDKGVK